MPQPSFNGFPPEALQFLRDLQANNNRAWFEAHKTTYTDQLITPAKHFINAMGARLRDLDPDVQFSTSGISGSMTRIYRDVRFSKDKTPYNTWLGFAFWQGSPKKKGMPAYMFGLGTQNNGVHVGLHSFDRPLLAAYRAAVVDELRGARLESAIAAVEQWAGYQVGGLHYKRVPRGYASDHPRAELLRYAGLFATAPTLDDSVVCSAELVETVYAHCEKMHPIQQWLVDLLHTL